MGEAKLVFLSFKTKYLTPKIGQYIKLKPLKNFITAYFMALKSFAFWLVGVRSVKTRIRTGLFPSVFNRLFNILINETDVFLICLKTLCVKNKVLSGSTFVYSKNF